MAYASPSQRGRLLEYIRTLGPTSALEGGLSLASSGEVTECSKSGTLITGVVRGHDSVNYSTKLEVTSPRNIEGSCSCAAQGLVAGEWCAHAIALLWRAHDLGFFSADSGFATREATYRPVSFSANDIAAVIRDIGNKTLIPSDESPYFPEVIVLLDVSGDRLGVQIQFDHQVQEPALFEGYFKPSARELDNLLLRVVDEHGAWDEEHTCWYVNSSEGIQLVLGLLKEFPQLVRTDNFSEIKIVHTPVQAQLVVRWMNNGAEVSMEWALPNGELTPKKSDLLGTGPFWVVVDNCIYPVAGDAAKIALLFPRSPKAFITKTSLGPILETLSEDLPRRGLIKVIDVEHRPLTETTVPEVSLTLEKKDSLGEHFSSGEALELIASLNFIYPDPPEEKNLVFLPNREKEKEAHDFLTGKGFEYQHDARKYFLRGDAALDLIYEGKKQFPSGWKIDGLEQAKRGLRFVDSTIHVQLTGSGAEGSVKPSKSRAESGGKIDWFDCHVSLVLNNANVPLSTLFKGKASDDDRWLKLDSGAYTKVPGGSFRQLKGMLGIIDPNFRLSNSIKSKLGTASALGLARFNGSQFSLTLDNSLKTLAQKLDDFSGIKPLKISSHFEGNLRPYQFEGVNWLNFLNEYRLGGILADEMGLGKTVQTLAFLLTLKEKLKKTSGKASKSEKWKPSLVIAPTSVITNWWYEAKRFTPHLKTLLLHGSKRKQLFSSIPEQDLIITSYALLRVDRYELERLEFNYIILDEAQHIKNYQAATTIAAKSLKSSHRLALSGTPTENRPLELWSLLDFLMPGYLGSHEFFRTNIERPILEQGHGAEIASFLRSKTRPFLLRRTKDEVEKELPPKVETVLHVEMTTSQRELYNQILEEVRPKVFEAVNQRGVAGASVSILAALLRLRQVCNHPNSIEALKEMEGFDSGKFNLLKDLLEEALENGRKILLFGQFREMLSIIRRHLDSIGLEYLYLDGATKDRQPLIDRFNNDPNIRLFLISLKAGGLGLNLATADTVIIYDPWWNPAVENQAIDRAHRIGQKKTVHVYRLVTEESVEQKIMELKRKKSAIINALINEGGISTLTLSKNELEHLFAPLLPEESERT